MGPDGLSALATALVAVHTALCGVLLLRSLVQLSLVRGRLRRGRAHCEGGGRSASEGRGGRVDPGRPLPFVTVQLPIYNEQYVVERLIDHVLRLDYPKDRLEVQVLDDSTDETVALVAEKVREGRARGIAVHHVRRATREGFKAGALRAGLASARGELIAVFDADFMPAPSFLRATVPHFDDPQVGMVQTRWGHTNRGASLLTRVQALLLDAHFEVDQRGRSEQRCFINFNGTAGVWRAAAIRDAGGWEDETLTEDLDLSYRAQLRGWRFVYLNDVESPAELPEDIRSLRSQQFRWMKGLAQNAVRLVPRILRADLPPRVKLHACAHLLESSVYLPTLALPLLMIPLALLQRRGLVSAWTFFNPVFVVSAVMLVVVYFVPQRGRLVGARGVVEYARLWVGFLVVTMGLSLHNSVAVLSGLLGRPGEFVRTPKRDLSSRSAWRRNDVYLPRGLDRVAALEAAVWLYLAAGLAWGALHGSLHFLWAPALVFVGLTYVLGGALRDALAQRWERRIERP